MMKYPNILQFAIPCLLALLFAGCQTTVTNLTPSKLPENPSGIYTFSFVANADSANIMQETVEARLVINGETHTMTRDSLDNNLFAYDFPMPQGQTNARYYYTLTYNYTNRDGKILKGDVASPLYDTRLVNRYPIQLEVNRGPVGARVSLVGRGFSKFDTIVVGDTEVATQFASPNAVSFSVPALAANKTYSVALRTGQGDIPAGNFRIDAAQLKILPASLDLAQGERSMLIVSIDTDAPAGGLYLNITTDAPASIIMPEATIAAGTRSVNVALEGGEPGTGTLFIESPGFTTKAVPLNVR